MWLTYFVIELYASIPQMQLEETFLYVLFNIKKVLPYDVLFAQLIIVIVLSTEPIIPAIKAPMIDASKN